VQAVARLIVQTMTAGGMVHTALMVLDFHPFELIQDETGWRVETEPYGASEVVVRFPAMRRLTHAQARHLIQAPARLQSWLRPRSIDICCTTA